MSEGSAMLAAELSDIERKFCDEYMIDFDATRAAKACSYAEASAGQRGYELLQRPQIQEHLKFLKSQQSVRTKITADYVLGTIVETLERCKQEIKPVLNKKGEQVMVEDPDGNLALAYKFDAKSVLKATELLGKHLSLFTDVVDNRHTFTQMPDVKVGLPDIDGKATEVKSLDFNVGSKPNEPRTIS